MKFAIVAAVLVGVAMAAAPAPVAPVFDGDWTSFESNELDISQGEYTIKGDEVCCSATASQCKVQTIDQQGTSWQSYSLQATRQGVPGGSIITFIKENPQYEYAVAVNASSGLLTCESKCPILAKNKLEPIVKNWFIGTSGNGTVVTYRGKAAYPGSPNACGPAGALCEVWEAKDTILGIVTMETAMNYVNIAGSAPVPVAQVVTLTPFGEHLGTEKTLYEEYKGFPNGFPADVFTFANKANCPPPSQGCNPSGGGGGGGGGGSLSAYKMARNNAHHWPSHITEKVKARFAVDIEAMFA